MSIFSSLFSRETEDDYELEAGQSTDGKTGQSNSATTGELCEGMRIDVTTPDGTPLLAGKITALTSTTLTLERLPGGLAFKICSLEAAVCASGYDKKMIPISLRATVQESTRTLLKLKNVQVETHAENREAFRLPLSVPVSLYRWDDEHYKTPEECILVDISTGGCRFTSEYLHGEGEVLRIKVKLEDYVAMDFIGEVIRVVECGPNEFRCGVLFAQLKKEEINSLTKVLFNMQLGNRREHSRTEDGHW